MPTMVLNSSSFHSKLSNFSLNSSKSQKLPSISSAGRYFTLQSSRMVSEIGLHQMELGTRKSLLFYLWPKINNISKNGEANHKATLKMLRGSKSMFKDKFY